MNRDTLLWLVVGALIIVGLGTGVFLMSRGIRNNNPGNIRHGGSQWQGMSAQQTDAEYVQFDDPIYGIRAMAKLLTNYQKNYGLDTIREIITRWAPPSENITSAYITAVSQKLGASPDQTIDVVGALPRLVPAIIYHENGEQPYSDAQISRGIALAS
jgi:hypothetical protein